MSEDRRSFLKSSALAVGGVAVGAGLGQQLLPPTAPPGLDAARYNDPGVFSPPTESNRYAERVWNNTWQHCCFIEIQKGDVFRLFESDGAPVDDGEVCIALADGRLVDFKGVGEQWSVAVENWEKYVRRVCDALPTPLQDYVVVGGAVGKGRCVERRVHVAGAPCDSALLDQVIEGCAKLEAYDLRPVKISDTRPDTDLADFAAIAAAVRIKAPSVRTGMLTLSRDDDGNWHSSFGPSSVSPVGI